MTSVAPKSDDTTSLPEDDEAEMTSIMSADQRRVLQQAASNSTEAETLERDTAKPPPSPEATADVAVIKIPKAPALPGAASRARAARAAPPVGASPRVARAATPAPSPAPATGASWAAWELVAFVLLAVAVAAALKM